MKKSKAQQAYERLRKNLLQARSRAEKRGSELYFDLPLTPKQALKGAGRNPKASDYREAMKTLKELQSMFREREREEREAKTLPDASEAIIDNFLKDINFGEGGQIIVKEVDRLKSTYGAPAVAKSIKQMQDDGTLVTRAELYNPEYAFRYVAEMGQYLQGAGIVSFDDWLTYEDALYADYGEMVPDELQ